MNRTAAALLVLCLAILACSLEPTAGTNAEPFPKPNPSPAPSKGTQPTETPITPGTCTVTAEGLHLRDAPTVNGIVIGWLFAGDVATIESTRGAWYEVTTSRGAGFIHSHYCEIQKGR